MKTANQQLEFISPSQSRFSNTVDPLVRKEPGRIYHDVLTRCDDFWPKFSEEEKAPWAEQEQEILERLGVPVS